MKTPRWTAPEAILESISDGVFAVDDQFQITAFNRAAEQITGVSRADALGRRCSDVFRSSLCESGCALRSTIADGRPLADRTAFIVDAGGRRIPITLSTAVLRTENGTLAGGVETFKELVVPETVTGDVMRMGDLVGCSAAMRRLFDLLPPIAESDATVLVVGETGTGKELVARALHDLGPRRSGPFVAVNCGALPDTLIESELFGYRAGAFTDARRDKPGRIALAEGGTLFLDEVGEFGAGVQAKLLRVLQDRLYQPLGTSRTIAADIRIIAATNRDLGAMVRAGAFRADLFYRLDVLRIELPPLRERRCDVPVLVERLLERIGRRRDRAAGPLGREAMDLLLAHDWPGNVRELENALEHAVALASGGTIEPHHLPRSFNGPARAGAAGPLQSSVRDTEARTILEALRRNGQNRLAAARELGIHKSTLFRKLRSLGINPEEAAGGRG